jgi:hypothetical protein
MNTPAVSKLIVIAALLLPQAAAAGEVVIAAHSDFSAAAVRIERQADYVGIPVTIEAEIKDPIERLDRLRAAMDVIDEGIAATPGLTIETEVVSLSPRKAGSFMALSSDYGSRRSTVRLFVMGELSDSGDIFSQTKKIHRALGRVKLPEDISLDLGNTALGLRDPESYRSRLLEMIRDHVAATKQSLEASGSVTVRGLESPVFVSQKNDTEVVLYLTYGIEVSM